MANEWSKIVRQVAARMNTIAGAQEDGAVGVGSNASYSVLPFTATSTDSAAYPHQMIVDACADAEAAIAQAIGQAANHPWRQYLIGGTLSRLSGSELIGPVGTLTAGVLGYGNVRSSTGIICTEKPLEDIMRRNRNAGSFFTLPVYFYRIADNRIYHTLTSGTPAVPASATLDYYKYDYEDTINAIFSDLKPKFPTSAVPAYIAGALSLLLKEDEYPATAQHYTGLFQQLITQIIGGYQAVDPAQPSSPITGSQIV
jgi:hypothetical protein